MYLSSTCSASRSERETETLTMENAFSHSEWQQKLFKSTLALRQSGIEKYVNVFHASDIRCLIYHFELHDCECGFVMQTLICSSRCTDINAIVCHRLPARIWRVFVLYCEKVCLQLTSNFEKWKIFSCSRMRMLHCNVAIERGVRAHHTFAHISRAYIESCSGLSLP